MSEKRHNSHSMRIALYDWDKKIIEVIGYDVGKLMYQFSGLVKNKYQFGRGARVMEVLRTPIVFEVGEKKQEEKN